MGKNVLFGSFIFRASYYCHCSDNTWSYDIQNGSCWSLRYSFINLKNKLNGQGITEIWNFHAFIGDPRTPKFPYCLNLT